MQAAIEASRELLRSGKMPPPGTANAPRRRRERGQRFNPEEINPPVATKGGMTALLHAARQGYIDAARALLDGGADINQVSAGDGTSPLLTAVINGQFDMAMLLIERGANPNLAAKQQRRDAAVGRGQHRSGSRARASRSRRKWSCRRRPTST